MRSKSAMILMHRRNAKKINLKPAPLRADSRAAFQRIQIACMDRMLNYLHEQMHNRPYVTLSAVPMDEDMLETLAGLQGDIVPVRH